MLTYFKAQPLTRKHADVQVIISKQLKLLRYNSLSVILAQAIKGHGCMETKYILEILFLVLLCRFLFN